MGNTNNNASKILNDLFGTYKNTSGYKDMAMMEVAGRKREFEENLDEMWSIYMKGNLRQITNYQSQLDHLKSLGFKILRNSAGKHKIVVKR